MLRTAYGKDSMSKSQAFEWFSKFKCGVTSVQKTKENVDQEREVILNDRSITIREISDTLGLLLGNIQSFLTGDLKLRRIAAKFVPASFQMI
ncbi:hypothetical protein C0J52_20695 [Blattella germanica]|nr:hypothetical protein C0J52_20695 [Blattella germanica]